MKISVDGADLHAAASWAAKFTNYRVSNLAGVILDVGERAEMSATNYELFGTCALPATVLDEGSGIVSGRGLSAVTALLTRGDVVTLSVEDSVVTIRRDRTRWTLPEIAPDFRPLFPSVGEQLGSVDGDALKAALKQVLPAVTDGNGDSDAGIVTSAGVEVTLGRRITLVATDRYRISSAEVDWESLTEQVLVIPESVCKSIAMILAGPTRLYSDGFTVTVATDTHKVTGRLYGGKFLNWRNAVPSAQSGPSMLGGIPGVFATTTVTVDTAELLGCVKRVGVFSVTAGKRAGDYLQMSFDPESIKAISCNRAHEVGRDGDGSDVIEPLAFDGRPITIAIQPHYLSEALSTITTPRVVLTFMDRSFAPVLLRGADEDEICEDFFHVLMPLNIAARAVA